MNGNSLPWSEWPAIRVVGMCDSLHSTLRARPGGGSLMHSKDELLAALGAKLTSTAEALKASEHTESVLRVEAENVRDEKGA